MNLLKDYIQQVSPISAQSWNILSECLTDKAFQKGALLLKEGEVCDAIYFIEEGFCKAVYNKDGKEVNIAFYFENDFATQSKSLIGAIPSDLNLIACENMQVVRFDKCKLLDAYQKSQEIEAFGRKLLELIMMKQEEHANSFKLWSPQERYEQLMHTYPQFFQRVSLTQAASYLGISRETLSRIRSR